MSPLYGLQQGPYGERSFISTDNGLFCINLRTSKVNIQRFSLFIHFYLPEPSHENRGKYLVTVHGAPRGRKAYIQ